MGIEAVACAVPSGASTVDRSGASRTSRKLAQRSATEQRSGEQHEVATCRFPSEERDTDSPRTSATHCAVLFYLSDSPLDESCFGEPAEQDGD